MKLVRFDLHRYSLPLSQTLALKGATLRRREGLLLKLVGSDGSEGWGESAPLPGLSEESLDQATEQLRRLAGSMIGGEVTGDWVGRDGALSRELDRIAPAPSVRFGFELAVWNLYAAASGKTLPELVARPPRTTVPVNGLLSGSPNGVLGEARRMREAGYRTVKLKVGVRTVAGDLRLVRELGEVLGDSISLRLDANRAWGYEEAAEFVRAAPRFEYVEEPLSDPARLPHLAGEFSVPVALDESLVGMEPEELGEHRYARAVVLKPTLLGGISRTLRTGRAGTSSRHEARDQFGLRERRGDGGPRSAGRGYWGASGGGGAGHLSHPGERRSPGAARPAGTERRCRTNGERLTQGRRSQPKEALAGSGTTGYTVRHVASFLYSILPTSPAGYCSYNIGP